MHVISRFNRIIILYKRTYVCYNGVTKEVIFTMDIEEKLKILADAAKYDVSCSSSGSDRKNKKGEIGSASTSGICHSFTSDGRCISLLKILLTNNCIFDCAYCVNRVSSDLPRATFTPDEVADLTINFYRRNYIEGLFLSSAVFKNPDFTMELLIQTVTKLRKEYHFNGYIHIKVIPGASEALISKAGLLVDRMSINIELPSNTSLKLLAPQKTKDNILMPMSIIKHKIIEAKSMRKGFKNAPLFVPAGQSTQLIVGATPESDYKILTLSESLYSKYSLKRVYYSAYMPVSNHPALYGVKGTPMLREHRLYQADWLLRFYGFKANELLNEASPNFNMNFDPKTDWALKHIEEFPIEINKASFQELLRIPGIGMRSAYKIRNIQLVHNIQYEDLKKIGVVLKRARYFITCNGKYNGGVPIDTRSIESRLLSITSAKKQSLKSYEQLSFMEKISTLQSNKTKEQENKISSLQIRENSEFGFSVMRGEL